MTELLGWTFEKTLDEIQGSKRKKGALKIIIDHLALCERNSLYSPEEREILNDALLWRFKEIKEMTRGKKRWKKRQPKKNKRHGK